MFDDDKSIKNVADAYRQMMAEAAEYSDEELLPDHLKGLTSKNASEAMQALKLEMTDADDFEADDTGAKKRSDEAKKLEAKAKKAMAVGNRDEAKKLAIQAIITITGN